ncbi:MAG: hypothetical protein C0411_21115 [Pseudomonas sp.]|nr:hypothetical protein [Pseudomonas sp.]
MVIGLVVANTGLLFMARSEPSPDLVGLQLKIATLEKNLPARESAVSWAEKARPALEAFPQEDPAALLTRLRDLSTSWHFDVIEAASRGGDPANVLLAGQGPYQSITALISEIERCDAARLDRLSLTRQDNEAITAAFELSVRRGPWRETPCATRPEVATESTNVHQFGNDPFNAPAPPVQASANKPDLKFKGYCLSPSGATAIVEIGSSSNVLLAKSGEHLPGGERLVSVTPDNLEIEDGGGARWKYAIEKSP